MSQRITVRQLAWARSGDKGNHANIGVVAQSEEAFRVLRDKLTSDVMQNHFSSLGITKIERFELPRLWGLNFLLYDALGGGASQSLRIDTQGKLLGTMVLDLELSDDDSAS